MCVWVCVFVFISPQGAAPAAVELTLGSLEVQPVSLQGASAWFKQQVHAQHKSHQHQYREVSKLCR